MNDNFLIIVDAGHGGRDSGAVANGYKEKDLNLQTALILEKYLKKYFSNILLTRRADITFNLSDRCNWISKKATEHKGKTICLSVHFNAFNGIARGVETIHSIYAKSYLATNIAKKICSLGIPFRRVFTRPNSSNSTLDYYALHRLTGRAETVIIEPLFLDNSQDMVFLKDIMFLDRLAKKYLEGLLEYCEIPLKKIEEPPQEEPPQENWKYVALEELSKAGLLGDLDEWKEKINEPMPVWASMLLNYRIYNNLKKIIDK